MFRQVSLNGFFKTKGKSIMIVIYGINAQLSPIKVQIKGNHNDSFNITNHPPYATAMAAK